MPRRWETEKDIARRRLTNVVAGIDLLDHAVITGRLPLRKKYGDGLRDTFAIRIVYPDEFVELGPRLDRVASTALCPTVYLDSHRDVWKQSVDGHILRDWSLCLYVPGESSIDFMRLDSLERLIATTQTFLMLQRIYQRDLKALGDAAVWPGPQRSHGPEGLWEAVRDRGGSSDDDGCVCGSAIPFASCHKTALESFTRPHREVA